MIYGSKCGFDGGFLVTPETLGSIYAEIIRDYGQVQLNKPIPGDYYRKMPNPLSDIDRPVFRRLPGNITIVSPPRLYRSNEYKYGGNVFLECESDWQFQYEYEFANEKIRDWMPVRLLSYCYIYQTLTFPKPVIQLELFS